VSGRTPDVGGAEALSVQVQGGDGEPEKLFVLSRPRDGVVEVRELRFGAEHGTPAEYSASAAELYDAFVRAQRERRRVSEDLNRIRRWLDV
jgi:hypothetical protein